MKVLYVVTAYPRSSADVITPWLTETIRRLREVDVEVEVLAPAYRGMADQEIDGVRVHRFRYAPARWETLTHDQTAPDRIRERPWYLLLVPTYLLAASIQARRLVRGNRFDVVHAFWPLPHGLIGLAAKRATGVPLVSTFFGVELTWLEKQMPFLKPVLRHIVRSSNAVTAISTYTAGELLTLEPTASVEVIPFGAATEVVPFPAASARSEPRSEPLLLFIGRLVERKGVQELLLALARLRDRGRPVSLTVVGEGPYANVLRRLTTELGLAELVRFEGVLPERELAVRLASCDALVLPAVRDAKGDVEGLGVVLIEALRAERPVIASEIGGIPDIVRHGETGLLVPPSDPDALAAAILLYVDHPDVANEHAKAGRRDVEERFSWDAIVGRLRAVYTRVVEESR